MFSYLNFLYPWKITFQENNSPAQKGTAFPAVPFCHALLHIHTPLHIHAFYIITYYYNFLKLPTRIYASTP